MLHVRRALAELDAVKCSGIQNGTGNAGEVRLGLRMPPIGEPLGSLLAGWREKHPNVELIVSEMNDRDLAAALEERRLDVALITSHTLWPHAAAVPLYRERIVAALPLLHPLAEHETVDWAALRGETFLVQGWDEVRQRVNFTRPSLEAVRDFARMGSANNASLRSWALALELRWRQRANPKPRSQVWYSSRSPNRTLGFKLNWRGSLAWRTPQLVALSRSCATKHGHGAFSEVDGARRSLAKARSVAIKRASIGPISFAGSTAL